MNGNTVEHRLDAEGADQQTLAGVNDANLQELARLSGCRVILRGDHLILSGEIGDVERAVPVAQRMIDLTRTGQDVGPDEIRRGLSQSQTRGRKRAPREAVNEEEGGVAAARTDEEQVVLALRVNVIDAPPVADDFDRLGEAGDLQRRGRRLSNSARRRAGQRE